MLNQITTMLALGLTAASATQLFHNAGNLSDWDFVNEEHSGTVQEVTNLFLSPSSSLKMTQIFDDSYDGRYHSEVVKNDVYSLGDEGFYGFAFRLQEDWEFDPPQSFNLGQFIADFGDTGCDDWMPSSMVWLEGDQLMSRVKQGSVCEQVTETFDNLASVTAGEWHKVVIQARWRADETGFYKVWFDGEKVFEQFDIATTVDDERAFEMRVGLYANGWYDDGGMQGSQGTRQVWYDEIAAGSEFGDVDSGEW
ncbi:hypothetical protein FQN54_006174 [Arachnomyces sp. PD_36]|nr:hypothetical protein FQN54_006174 [Arachnomyces sp. PD_36]